MPFFKNIKQKVSNLFSKNHILAVFCLVLFFVFFYSHGVNALDDMDIDTSAIDAGKSMGGIGNPLTWLITWLLGLMLKFVSVLLSGAETLFTYIVDPANMKAIMDNNAIYTTWRTVRDVFNIAFIMVLLFSAFCTIFQVSKYGIKTIWLNLVLMALLVNFSYPIARFIIDASNMLMYGFLNNMGGAGSFMSIIQKSGINGIIATQSPEPLFLLSAVVFTFILAITLLVIAVLLVIRTITLAIYIVFSPVAFVGTILPGELGKESGAGGWWDGFLKQCFAGPIIIFMLYIANTMMSAIGSSEAVIKLIADTQVPGGSPNPYYTESLAKLIAQASYFSMPVVILWVGIMTAQKSGIYGAEKAVGYGTKLIKGAGKKFSGYNAIKKQYDAYAGQRKKREEEKAKNRVGGKIGKWVNKQQDALIGTIPILGKNAAKRVQNMKEAERRDDMDKNAKKSEDTKTTIDMVTNVNNTFNATGTIDPSRKISSEEAGDAKAFTRRSSDEKKDLILNNAGITGIGSAAAPVTTIPATSPLHNVLGGITPSIAAGATGIQRALYNVMNNPAPTENDLRTVAAFVGRQSEEVMRKYVSQ